MVNILPIYLHPENNLRRKQIFPYLTNPLLLFSKNRILDPSVILPTGRTLLLCSTVYSLLTLTLDIRSDF
jgi:hypothetical protein